MINMIVADDEIVIIKGINKLLHWDTLGIKIVGEYSDGKKALEGILALSPHIALLDINMPRMSGMEILKEINERGLNTMVIFISGFQEFTYAREALIYGAKDYLLKPIIKEDLMKAIEKCIAKQQEDKTQEGDGEVTKEEIIPYNQLIELEESHYFTVLFEIIYENQETIYERRLVQFAAHTFLENDIEREKKGIVFVKNNHTILVLKGMDRESAKEFLYHVLLKVSDTINHKVGAILGNEVDSMSKIAVEYNNCVTMIDYFFFHDQMKSLLLEIGKPVFHKETSIMEWENSATDMQEAILGQNEKEFSKCLEKLNKLICILADGRKEDACFYWCNVIRSIEEWFVLKGLNGLNLDIKSILKEGRKTSSYREMTDIFYSYLEEYKKLVSNFFVGNEKRDIMKALDYIEKNYMKNITLEILADVVHMNSSYFSTYFKKHMNMNFKDFLNKVRMKHAITLLLTTNQKIYNIADMVGFRDVRSFNELFFRQFHETPNSYRKRITEKNTIPLD